MNKLFSTFYSLFQNYDTLLVSGALVTGSILLYRKSKSWPTLLQLVGSAAYFLEWIHNSVTEFFLVQGWIHHGRFWFPTSSENSLISVPFGILHLVAVCFPIGFIWYAIRVVRSHPTSKLSG